MCGLAIRYRAHVLFHKVQEETCNLLLYIEGLPPMWTRPTHRLGGRRVNAFVRTIFLVMLRSAWATEYDAILQLPHLPYEIWMLILLCMPRQSMKLKTNPPECEVVPPPLERSSLRSRRASSSRRSSTGSGYSESDTESYTEPQSQLIYPSQ